MIYKSDHRKKGMRPSYNLTPILVFYDIRTLDIIEFVGQPPFLENHIRDCHFHNAHTKNSFKENFVSHSQGPHKQFDMN